ncbi:MAG: hypothetical protein R3F61_37555 [Myxococcota bacterium]
MMPLWIASASAAIVTSTVEICVAYDTEYEDVGSEDFWADQTVDRWARGVELEIRDYTSRRFLFTNQSTGCLTTQVETESGDPIFKVVVRSRALVQGVEYEVHPHQGTASWASHVGQFQEELFLLDAGVSTHDLTTSSHEAWQVMGAVSWLFHRSRFKIWNGVSRMCCFDNAQPDGTCTNSSYWYGVSNAQTLHYFVRTNGGPCGGGNATAAVDDRLNAVEIAGDCPRKGLFVHETAHMIVGLRMNGREGEGPNAPNSGPQGWNPGAPLDGCSGDYWLANTSTNPPLGVDPIDYGQASAKGRLTKEFGSNAIREGWADFMAMWAWNSRNGTDCHSESWVSSYQDLDLDGTVENHPAQEMDCASIGCWLDDVESATGNGCDRAGYSGSDDLELNRSTVWDVGRMYWYLWQTEGVSTDRLSDLYVHTCPRVWSVADEWKNSTADHASRPIDRLYDASAFHPSTQAAVDAAIDAYVAH